MADPTRSRILLTLLEGPEYPAVLAHDLDLTRSNVSNHLACLRDCGIVVGQHQGRQTRYEIADPHLAQALTALVDTTRAVVVAAACIDPVCTVVCCTHDRELGARIRPSCRQSACLPPSTVITSSAGRYSSGEPREKQEPPAASWWANISKSWAF